MVLTVLSMFLFQAAAAGAGAIAGGRHHAGGAAGAAQEGRLLLVLDGGRRVSCALQQHCRCSNAGDAACGSPGGRPLLLLGHARVALMQAHCGGRRRDGVSDPRCRGTAGGAAAAGAAAGMAATAGVPALEAAEAASAASGMGRAIAAPPAVQLDASARVARNTGASHALCACTAMKAAVFGWCRSGSGL